MIMLPYLQEVIYHPLAKMTYFPDLGKAPNPPGWEQIAQNIWEAAQNVD